jgi:hypothetical protein
LHRRQAIWIKTGSRGTASTVLVWRPDDSGRERFAAMQRAMGDRAIGRHLVAQQAASSTTVFVS